MSVIYSFLNSFTRHRKLVPLQTDTVANGMGSGDLDGTAVAGLDRMVGVNSDGVLGMGSDVVAGMDLDAVIAIDSGRGATRVAADNS